MRPCDWLRHFAEVPSNACFWQVKQLSSSIITKKNVVLEAAELLLIRTQKRFQRKTLLWGAGMAQW